MTRLVLINSIGPVNTEEAQRILLWFVLKRPRSEEEVEMVYTHAITFTNPIPPLVTELEKECFGQKFEKHGLYLLYTRAVSFYSPIMRNMVCIYYTLELFHSTHPL